MADELKNISKGIQELVTVTKKEFDKLAGKVGSEIDSVMSEEMKMISGHVKSGFDSFKNTGGKFLKFIAGGSEEGNKLAWWGLKLQRKEVKQGKEQLAFEKKQAGIMKDMHFWAKWRHKASLLSFKKIAKGGLGALIALIGIPLMALGAIIGTMVGLLAKPFQLIGKVLFSFGKFFANLAFGAKKVEKWGRLFRIMLAGRGKFAKFFKNLRKLFKFFSKIPLIGHLIKGLKFGFKKLFWPLQLILSTIDFVKGFMDTEGTIYEKIKGGIENVIVKFLEFPAQLLGKMWEWFQVNFLGKDPASIEQGAAAKSIIDGISKTVKMIFEGWELIFGILGTAFNDLWDIVKGLDWKALRQDLIGWGKKLTGIYAGIKDFILGLFGIEKSTVPKQSEIEKNLANPHEAARLTGLRKTEAVAREHGRTEEAEKILLARRQLEEQIKANVIAKEQLEAAKRNQPVFIPAPAGTEGFTPAQIDELREDN